MKLAAIAPSAPSDDEIARRLATSREAQRKAFERHGLVVVPTRGKAEGLPRLVQIAVEAWAKTTLKAGESR